MATLPPPSSSVTDAVNRPNAVGLSTFSANGASLARRSEGTHSNMLSHGTSVWVADSPEGSLKSELAYLDNDFDNEAGSSSTPPSPTQSTPMNIGQSNTISRNVDTGSSQGQQEEETVVVAENALAKVEQSVIGASDAKPQKAVMQAANLPRIDTTTFKPPPSAFSRMPDIPNARDSLLTQHSIATHISTASSSVYPPSTSTASGPESPPSPRSLAEQIDNHDVSSYDPEVDEMCEYRGDDVSYRLRLLVNNNYFLPPAHAKPNPEEFAAALNAQKKSARAVAPTFFDLFRVGKSKSKPPSPSNTPVLGPRVPVLRTTSDSVTFGGHVSRIHPRLVPATPLTTPHPTKPPDRSGRVVVVREKMHDLATAAKQAEQEMKARGVRRDQPTQKDKTDYFDDVIDPTDAVDLPPPSSKYPFAVQASALHGLGVQDSVGAAQLAERLPPPMSPGLFSLDPEDLSWRKALLQAAVGHSFDNTPDISAMSISPDFSSPLASPLWIASPGPETPQSGSRVQTPDTKRMLGQRIMNQPLIETEQAEGKSSPTPLAASKAREHNTTLLVPLTTSSRPTSSFLVRCETPSGPQTPLAPPPRRNFINPLYSLSQTDLLPTEDIKREPQDQSNEPVLQTTTSPMLSDAYESARQMAITPPPDGIYSAALMDPGRTPSFETSREHSAISVKTAESHYSFDEHEEDAARRPSTILSGTEGRPSISEYSQPSPTVSAFQDAINSDGYHSAASSFHRPWQPSVNLQSSPRDSPAPRDSTVSPPPRVSSSLANIALSPPPRSLHQRVVTSQAHSFLDLGEPSTLGPTEPTETAAEETLPTPAIPPYPNMERRGNPGPRPLDLSVPANSVPVELHSAPPPSSPTSFFDSIQTQPNAMDDLDSSSDEDEDEEDEEVDNGRGPTNLYVDPRTRTISTMTARPNIMRLGNHSTPYISRPMEYRPTLPYRVVDSKKAVGNIAQRTPFFADRMSGRSEQGHGLPSSTLDFYNYSRQYSREDPGPPARRRPATADQQVSRTDQSASESSKKLDGILKQHMEAEKDVIRRIAMTLHSNHKT